MRPSTESLLRKQAQHFLTMEEWMARILRIRRRKKPIQIGAIDCQESARYCLYSKEPRP